MEKEKRERLPVSVSSAVFISENGKLLLLRQAGKLKGNKWGPPAGGMEAHENPITAAKRETKEEIGVDVNPIDLIGIYTVDRGDTASGISFVFRGEIIFGSPKIKEGEIAEYKYFTPEEIEDLIKENRVYKPEYFLSSYQDWLNGISYPLDVVKLLIGN